MFSNHENTLFECRECYANIEDQVLESKVMNMDSVGEILEQNGMSLRGNNIFGWGQHGIVGFLKIVA